jgi:hypothetical protein
MERPGYKEVIMNTTVSALVQQRIPYPNQSANQKKSSGESSSASGEAGKASEIQKEDVDTDSRKVDTVDLTTTHMVSQSNRAASENEVEDIDAVAGKIQEVKQWLESEYESARLEQIHQLNMDNLVEVLS